MAFVANKWALNYTLRDNNGNDATVGFRLDPGVALADALATGVALRDAIAALSDAEISSYDISQRYVQDAPTGAAAVSEVERKLHVAFTDATGVQRISVEVPSPIAAIEQAGTDVVLASNALVGAFIAAVINGGGGAGNGPRTVGGADVTQLLGVPYITHRRRRVRK